MDEPSEWILARSAGISFQNEHCEAVMSLARVQRDCSWYDYVPVSTLPWKPTKSGWVTAALSIEHQKTSLGMNSCYEVQAITEERDPVLIPFSVTSEAI